MRIAIDTQSTLARKTGIGIYTTELLAALKQVAPENEYCELNWGADVPMRLDRRMRWQQFEFPRRVRQVHADLLHVPGFDAPIRCSKPVVLTVHDLIGMLFPQHLPPVSRFYWSRWLPFTVRYAHAIIADSEATRQDILRLLRVNPERITVIPLGVSDTFRPASPESISDMRKQYGLKLPYILNVGTIEPRKGIDTLIDAFAHIAHDHPHDLVLVGKKGWYWESTMAHIDRNDLEGRVHVLDYVPASDLPSLYSGAVVFAFPSRYEGFGLPVAEAMACATPVVCANTSSLPEVAGSSAILIPPNQPDSLASAIRLVLDDPATSIRLKNEGPRQARKFTWNATARSTLDVYRTVLTKHTN